MEDEDAILHAVATWQAQAPLAFADRENPLLTEHPGMTEIIACVKRMDRYPGDRPSNLEVNVARAVSAGPGTTEARDEAA